MTTINEGTSGGTRPFGRPLAGTGRFYRKKAYSNQPKGWNNDPTQYALWAKNQAELTALINRPDWQKSFDQSFTVRKPMTYERRSEIDERNELFKEIAVNVALELVGTQGTYGRLAKAVGKGVYNPYRRYQSSRQYRSRSGNDKRFSGNSYSRAYSTRRSSPSRNQNSGNYGRSGGYRKK